MPDKSYNSNRGAFLVMYDIACVSLLKKDIGCDLTDKGGEVILVHRSIINYLCLFCMLLNNIFRDVPHRDSRIMYIYVNGQ